MAVATPKRAGGHPPYERMASAEQLAREAHPDALNVRAMWTPEGEHDVHVEVWTTCERTGYPRADVWRPSC